MKKISSSRSVLLSWSISYLLILLIPIIIFIYGSFIAVSAFRAEVANANALILDSSTKELDEQLSAMKAAFKFTYMNSLFVTLRQAQQINPAFMRVSADLVKDLSAYVKAAKNEIGITVYFQNKDYLINNLTANQSATLYQAQSSTDREFTEWIKTLSGHYQNSYAIMQGIHPHKPEPCLVFCQSIRNLPDDINIFVSIPINDLAAAYDNVSDRSFIIAGKQGEILAAFIDEPNISKLDLNVPSGQAVLGNDSLSYICSYTKSTQADLYYAVITPEKSYWSRLVRVSYLFVASISLALVLGIAAVAFLLRKNYQPLKNVTLLLKRNDNQKNEFEIITNTYTDLKQENWSMRSVLHKQSSQLREHYLLSLLKGRSLPFNPDDMNYFYQLNNGLDKYSLIGIRVSAAADFVIQQFDDEFDFESSMLFAINNVFSEVMSGYDFDKIEDGLILFYLIHLADKIQPVWEEQILLQMNKIYSFFTSSFSIQLSIVISDNVTGIDYLGRLYRDVMDALEYQAVLEKSGPIRSSDFTSLSKEHKYQPEYLQQKLSDALRIGDCKACEQVLGQVFNSQLQAKHVTFPLFHIFTIHYLHLIMTIFNELITDYNLRQKLVEKSTTIMAAANEAQLKDELGQIMAFACQTIYNQRVGIGSLLVQQIIEHIQDNYADSNMNISSIADNFAKNPRYLSQLFSKNTGKNLLDFINNTKIEHAVRLMQTTELTLEEISLKVGFTNVRTFRRAFMRIHGVQPSRFDGTQT